MEKLDRRTFLRLLSASAVTLALGGKRAFTQDGRPFEFLVAGDSLVWGQGLEEKYKFYSLTADWLRSQLGRPINLKVKAHSGSNLKFHADEAAKYAKIGRDENYFFPPEVNVSFPSVYKQIQTASDEYRAEGKTADLIMVGGGITDITTARVLDPKANDEELKQEIAKYLRDDMFDVIDLAAAQNPGAKILVIGYYAPISKHSDSAKVLNAWLEALSFPRALKFIPNNPLIRPFFFNKLRKRAIQRSDIWYETSSSCMAEAVAKLNNKLGSEQAFFIRSPLMPEHATEAPDTLLFRMGKGGNVKDQKMNARKLDCRSTLPKLKKDAGIDFPVRLCEIAAIGHPDQAGSRLYAEAIIQQLKKII